MEFGLNAVIIIICLFGLWFGAEWFVETAVGIAQKLGISELVIGLTIVSIGTSAPEFAVSAFSALSGHANIAVGNVVGSNIFNLGIILGGVAVVRPIKTSRRLVFWDGGVLIFTTFLLLIFLRDLYFAQWEGIVLLFLMMLYIGIMLYRKEPPVEDVCADDFSWRSAWRFPVGLTMILVCSHFMVAAAADLARLMGVSEWVIGVTIVAVGTSLPEFFTSLVAVLKGHYGISAGNLVGSDIFNLLGVLGLAALIQPMSISSESYSSMFMLCGMVVAVVIMMRTSWRLSRVEGVILICVGLIRWILDFT